MFQWCNQLNTMGLNFAHHQQGPKNIAIPLVLLSLYEGIIEVPKRSLTAVPMKY